MHMAGLQLISCNMFFFFSVSLARRVQLRGYALLVCIELTLIYP